MGADAQPKSPDLAALLELLDEGTISGKIAKTVFEEMAVKKAVFAALDASCKPGTILASNTSYLDLDEIAAVKKERYRDENDLKK